MHLNGPSKEKIIAVISLLDLYGPTFYPAHLTDRDERYLWAKQKIEGNVQEENFFQFFAVHEVEAWILSTRGRHGITVGMESPPSVMDGG